MSLKKIYHSNFYTVLEFLFFFVFVPFLTNWFLDGWYKIFPLFIIAVIFFTLLYKDPEFDNGVFTRINREHLKRSVARVVVITLLLIWFTWWIFPDLLLQYPREDFGGYLITFIVYPFASVLPQEIIYRVYYFHRFKEIVPEKYLLILSNAIIFGLTHWIYGNWVAPIATFFISWIFIFSYLKSKSLLNVSIEHYFYGLVMFTVGFGYFFQ